MSSFLQDIFSTISDHGRLLIRKGTGLALSDRSMEAILEAVLSEKGEATGVALSHEALQKFESLDADKRAAFFDFLADNFGPDHEALSAAAADYAAEPTDANAVRVHRASESSRQELLRRLNRAPGGTASLVHMRSELLDRMADRPDLRLVDHDFAHLLGSWFNRGFLVLERIDWSTPAVILEKIIENEAVHEIESWEDLRRRIEPSDRRCYAFFHPALIDEPLIFVEVALTTSMPDAIGPILDTPASDIHEETADTAVFYSISNCQHGLRGVSFGNFLIKQVVEELSRDLPGLKTFVTLSPVPDFVRWLKSLRGDDPNGVLAGIDDEVWAALDAGDWPDDKKRAAALKGVLLPLAAHYYCHARTGDGEPLDPVARFHLGNGAVLERICWLGDRSPRALANGAGMMVNYLYDRQRIEENHERYVKDRTVAASSSVQRLDRRTRALVKA